MPRVKRGTKRRARRKKYLKRTKGFFLTKSKLYQSAQEAANRADRYAKRDRRVKKRQYRRLWIQRVGAAARQNGLTYGQLIHRLKAAGVALDRKLRADIDELEWKIFRDRWLGRKSGVLTKITDNWLKPATPELKRVVGACLNELRAYVETEIEARRAAIEAGTEESAVARERVDLSLPGVIRPVGSHHLIRQVLQEIEDIFFCDFNGTIEYFVRQFFGPGVKTRFRPSYFPFTEPSVEFDVSCPFCGGSGTSTAGGTCTKCKGAAWIELFGAGMVDPAVYGFVNYDPKKVSGFASGIGLAS